MYIGRSQEAAAALRRGDQRGTDAGRSPPTDPSLSGRPPTPSLPPNDGKKVGAKELEEDGGGLPVGAVVGTLCALLFVAAVSLLLVCMRCTKRQSDGASPEEARSTTGIDHDLDRDFKAMAMSADKEERMYHIPSP